MNLKESNLVNSLPVMEHFYTIQGEGFHQGRAAYFVRLGGCDVGCVWCDVKDSWDANAHAKKTVNEIVSLISQNASSISKGKSAGLVVITGGEPLMHDLTQLTLALKEKGFETNIETSGAHPLTGTWDWICLSPKKFKSPIPAVIPFANELKVVVFNESDFKWAEQYALLVSPLCKLYLQPEWDKAATITPSIIEYIKEHPQWELSLQIHKYINVP
jgi:organic radical activating enzyme